jgi:hypothetical protein
MKSYITDIKTMLTIKKPVPNLQQLIIIKNGFFIDVILKSNDGEISWH